MAIASGTEQQYYSVRGTADAGVWWREADGEHSALIDEPEVAAWLDAGNTPAAAPTPSLAQQAAALLAAGCAIVSTGDPAVLNGTYPVDAETRSDIMGELLSLTINSTFTNGTTTLPWYDASMVAHNLDPTQFKALATAIGAFVGACKTIIASGEGSLPTQPVTIA